MKSIGNTVLQFGQVEAPVKIYSAASSSDVTLNLCGPNGEPVEQVYRKKDDGEVIGTKADCSRSFEGKLIEEAEIKAAEAASIVEDIDGTPVNLKERIRIQRFVPLSKVPFDRAQGAYILGANTKAGQIEALALIQKALAKKKVAAIAKFILRGRQKMFAIYAEDGLLKAVTLSFASDANEPTEEVMLQSKVKVESKYVELASKVIDAQMDKDGEIINALSDTLVERKQELWKNGTDIKPEKPSVENIGSSLGDALEESLKVSVKA